MKHFVHLVLKSLFYILLLAYAHLSTAQSEPKTLGGGHMPNITITTSHSATTSTEMTTLSGAGLKNNLNGTSRFLGQATLGANWETMEAVADSGLTNWINHQLTLDTTFSLLNYVNEITDRARDSVAANGGDPGNVNANRRYWHTALTNYVMTGDDLLRARVALALSEIFVISEIPVLDNEPLGLASYYDLLLTHSFGNYRDLLYNVTLHPCMGVYLTHLNNPKTDTTKNQFPDENYAREVMQLFSIGLYELHLDGSRKLDTAGNFIPTYDLDEIEEFAKVFTGLSWGDRTQFGKRRPDEETGYTIPMQMFDGEHEPGPKNLLNGFVIPDRNPVDGLADINDAVDNLFNHPNVGPFISYLLIQRLVKSNPSPDYIARVAAVFNDDGSGIRGNLGATVKAILLDPEARDCQAVDDPFAGKLREPMIRNFEVARSFDAYTETGDLFRHDMDDLLQWSRQRPLASPSVFNFFQPDYQPIGPVADNNLNAPEFQILYATTALGYGTLLNDWVWDNNDVFDYHGIEDPYDSAKKTYLDLTDELALGDSNEKLDELMDRLNVLLAHGQLSTETIDEITAVIAQLPESDPEDRVRLAIWLVLMSPDYLIIR